MSQLIDLTKPAPRDPATNAMYRQEVMRRARGNIDFQQSCWIRSKRDIVWYVNTFGWTYNSMDHADHPIQPFILHKDQEDGLIVMSKAIGRQDCLVEKSRSRGASYLCLWAFEHRWHFYNDQSFLIGSRTGDYVDKAGNPKALFWKLDFMIDKLPSWLAPKYTRTSMHLENLENGSVIDGETTTADFGTGDRRTAILLDEFAKVRDNGSSIVRATQLVTKCRFFNSTPEGQRGAYYEEWKRMKREFPGNVIRLHWTGNPEYAAGLYTSTKDGTLKIIDKKYKFPANYQFILDGKVRSPWYDYQWRRAFSSTIIAQELDIDFVGSGGSVMDPSVCDRLVSKFARRWVYRGEFVHDERGQNPQLKESLMNGRFKLWRSILPSGRPIDGQYVIGVDIATGKGGIESTNSVIVVVNRLTGELVARFAANDILPQDLALLAVAVARYYYNAFLIWEDNGPGGIFGQRVQRLGYHNIFYREKDEKSADSDKTGKAGWWSDRETKKLLLSNYFYALAEGKFLNPDEESVRECLEYVIDDNGDYVHSKAEQSQNPLSSGSNHGDMVIACALAHRGVIEKPDEPEDKKVDAPVGSFQYRRELAQRLQNKTKAY